MNHYEMSFLKSGLKTASENMMKLILKKVWQTICIRAHKPLYRRRTFSRQAGSLYTVLLNTLQVLTAIFWKLTDFIYPLSERERSTHPFMNEVADVMKSLPPSGDDLCSAPMTEAPEPSSPSASPTCLKGSTNANDRHFSIVNAQNNGKEWNTGTDQFNVILNNDSQEKFLQLRN